MRQRRIKNLEEKTEALSRFIAEDPAQRKGRWRDYFSEAGWQGTRSREPELFLEIGCGKGRFLTTLAQKNPDKLYIGVEGADSVVLRALEKTEEKGLSNLLFITQYVRQLSDFFEEGELCGLYLNFSDPWPKDRHAKRRLTHESYLQSYQRALRPGSFIELKTDNDGLFSFSLQEFEKSGMAVLEQTWDLHRSSFPAKEIETEYEHKFRLLGSNIHYCKVRTVGGA